jgi:hypothetical protein
MAHVIDQMIRRSAGNGADSTWGKHVIYGRLAVEIAKLLHLSMGRHSSPVAPAALGLRPQDAENFIALFPESEKLHYVVFRHDVCDTDEHADVELTADGR